MKYIYIIALSFLAQYAAQSQAVTNVTVYVVVQLQNGNVGTNVVPVSKGQLSAVQWFVNVNNSDTNAPQTTVRKYIGDGIDGMLSRWRTIWKQRRDAEINALLQTVTSESDLDAIKSAVQDRVPPPQ